MKLQWYWRRLLAMNALEILFRLKLLLKKKYWKLVKPHYKPSLDYSSIDLEVSPISKKIAIAKIENKSDLIINEADKYLAHRWIFFGLDKSESEINWHSDPNSGIQAPIQFGFDINHRDEQLVGNIKNTWEKNRHHHLTILALAFYLTRDEKYAKEVKNQLESWIEQNPYLIGVNWTHPLEQGIRLIAWVYVFFLLKESKYFDRIFGEKGFIWNSVFEHQKFIFETYSRGSSANNHLIGEMAGLFISSKYWPVFKQSKKWNSLSKKILEREVINQTYSDGVNRELAFSYQIFVLEFALLGYMADPELFGEGFKKILIKKCDVVYQFSSIIGYQPNYGDGDEGMALQLQSLYEDRISWLLSLSNKLLKTKYLSEQNLPHFLLNCPDISESESVEDIFISKESGILAKKWRANDSEFAVLIDFGPLGMGSLAAHGHADALSFALTINSKPIIIDPGTFCYHDNLEWRSYFRSVKAHNTISINSKDQSEQTGPFLWGKRANCELINLEKDATSLTAQHDGYFRNESVLHERKFSFTDEGLIISDVLAGTTKNSIEMRFHFHPDIEIVLDEGSVRLPKEKIILEYDSRLSAKILTGDSEGGWYSHSFGSKIETNTLVLSHVLSLPVELATCIKIIDKK